jgi:hypothetical protein
MKRWLILGFATLLLLGITTINTAALRMPYPTAKQQIPYTYVTATLSMLFIDLPTAGAESVYA